MLRIQIINQSENKHRNSLQFRRFESEEFSKIFLLISNSNVRICLKQIGWWKITRPSIVWYLYGILEINKNNIFEKPSMLFLLLSATNVLQLQTCVRVYVNSFDSYCYFYRSFKLSTTQNEFFVGLKVTLCKNDKSTNKHCTLLKWSKNRFAFEINIRIYGDR